MIHRVSAALLLALTLASCGHGGGSDPASPDTTGGGALAIAGVLEFPDEHAPVEVGAGHAWVTVSEQNSVAVIDPTSLDIVAEVPVGRRPVSATLAGDHLFVTNFDDDTVSVVDPETFDVVETLQVGDTPTFAWIMGDEIWFPSRDGLISTFDSESLRPIDTITTEPNSDWNRAFNDETVWLRGDTETIWRIDSTSHDVTSFTGPDGNLETVGGNLWILDYINGDQIVVLDGDSGAELGTINAPSESLAATQSAVVSSGGGEIAVLDPDELSVTDSFAAHGRVSEVDGQLWVAGSGTVAPLDIEGRRVGEAIEVGGNPSVWAEGEGAIWVVDGDEETDTTRITILR